MLTSIRDLSRMGYKLYASMGTADFYTEHGIQVSFYDFFVNFIKIISLQQLYTYFQNILIKIKNIVQFWLH